MKENTRDLSESLAPSGDLQSFPGIPKCPGKFPWVVLTLKNVFVATYEPQLWVRDRVATQTCFEQSISEFGR